MKARIEASLEWLPSGEGFHGHITVNGDVVPVFIDPDKGVFLINGRPFPGEVFPAGNLIAAVINVVTQTL